MPKLPHEALVHLVRSAPEVIFRLLHHELGVEQAPVVADLRRRPARAPRLPR